MHCLVQENLGSVKDQLEKIEAHAPRAGQGPACRPISKIFKLTPVATIVPKCSTEAARVRLRAVLTATRPFGQRIQDLLRDSI